MESIMQRRQFLAKGGIVGLAATGAFSGGVVAKKSQNLVKKVQQDGHYGAIEFPSSGSLEGFIMSEKRPMKVTTPNDGEIISKPQKGGIRMQLDLPAGHGFGEAGFGVGQYPISDIDQIEIESTGDPQRLVIVLVNSDGRMYEWEEVKGNRLRWSDWAGDDRVLTAPTIVGTRTIDRDDSIFFSPADGPAGALADKSINDLQDDFGEITVEVALSLSGVATEDGDLVNEALVDKLKVVS